MCFPIILLILTISAVFNVNSEPVWRWECQNGYCQKERITPDTRDSALSLPACRLFCSQYATIWPKPTGNFTIGKYLAILNVNSIDVLSPYGDSRIGQRLRKATRRFKDIIETLHPNRPRTIAGKSLVVTLKIENTTITRLALHLDESYTLNVEETSDGRINATVTSNNYFGCRHGLETLAQLVIFDNIRNEFQIVRNVYIEDKPVYTYRGILLDTARNYMSVDTIKRTLEGMAISKLNTFHWHITDSHSFPYVSASRPELSSIGAYSPNKIYTKQDIAEIIEYGLIRGVRVMPEFDAPAHVGEGWQDTDFVACFNAHPWEEYCVEPPCGQLDPTNDGLYDFLEGIYKDMVDQFDPDIFHMGGDEVSVNCWNSTDHIVDWMHAKGWQIEESDFMKLWDIFQSKALERYLKHGRNDTPIIMWTSGLTRGEYVTQYLPKDRYIIQVWTTGDDPEVQDLLKKGYRLILSNYDALYLDCGFSGWVQGGENWCAPYKGWQKIYMNSPSEIAGEYVDQILGAEAALWSEQVDDSAVDSRLWPRATAMAERLWAEPADDWRKAEQRMLIQRERLVKRGLSADALEPQWCRQNEENCPIGGVFNSV